MNSAYLMLAASLLMAFIGYAVSDPVLHFLETPEDIFLSSRMYMRIMSLGIPLVGMYNHASSMLRALGDSRTPLVFLLVASAINIGLDLLFVCVFGMGVFGAAVATLAAQFLAGASCLLFAFFKNEYFRIKIGRAHV